MYSPRRSPCTSTMTVAVGASAFFSGEVGAELEDMLPSYS